MTIKDKLPAIMEAAGERGASAKEFAEKIGCRPSSVKDTVRRLRLEGWKIATLPGLRYVLIAKPSEASDDAEADLERVILEAMAARERALFAPTHETAIKAARRVHLDGKPNRGRVDEALSRLCESGLLAEKHSTDTGLAHIKPGSYHVTADGWARVGGKPVWR